MKSCSTRYDQLRKVKRKLLAPDADGGGGTDRLTEHAMERLYPREERKVLTKKVKVVTEKKVSRYDPLRKLSQTEGED